MPKWYYAVGRDAQGRSVDAYYRRAVKAWFLVRYADGHTQVSQPFPSRTDATAFFHLTPKDVLWRRESELIAEIKVAPRNRDIALIGDALRELTGNHTNADIAAWLDEREAPCNPVPGVGVNGEELPF